ncbi:ribosome 60S biogenesis N-terminal-domain-containing protein [Lentinula aff. detonsa]|nr:ribosome 60S biogenesis N-terminal-domain-containing protein [Lentinula aff. detonsa]
MLISLLCTILQFLRASADSDNRLARSLLLPERMAKLNTYLAGKSSNRNQNVHLVPDTLNLLAALVAWDPKTVLEGLRWDIEAFSRILRGYRNQKDGKGKGKERSKSHQYVDLRSRASLLSLIVAMLSQVVPARVKSAFLASGAPTLSLLQNILSGIGDSYDEEHYVYSYAQIKTLFETLYAGVWCDKRVSRSVKVAIFVFGQGQKNGLRNEGIWDARRGGQVAGEKVWKGLLALYTRTEHESSFPGIAEGKQTQTSDDEGGVPADLVHHFLLALCTRPGLGLCFRDQGWYPPNRNNKIVAGDDLNHDDEAHSSSNHTSSLLYADEDTQRNPKYNIHNPLLLRVLRLLTPTTDSRQQELAARILEACPELISVCSDLISGGPGALDAKVNARWMIGMAWYGRVVALPVPDDTLYMSATGNANAARTPRLNPPPVRNVVESIIPSFTGGGTKSLLTKALGTGSGTENRATGDATDQNTGFGLGLVQHTTALTLCRCLRKLTEVQTSFLRAARAVGELEEDEEMSYSNAGGSAHATGPWTRRLTEVNREVRARLPDIQVVLAFLKRIEVAASQVESLSTSPSTGTANSTALALLSESAHRLIWLYHACFISASTLSTAEEGLGRFDVGGLMANVSMFATEKDMPLQDNAAAGDISGLNMLKDVHILKTLSLSKEFGSRVFGKVGNLKQSPSHLLLWAFSRGSAPRNSRKCGHHVLHNEIRRLLEQVLSRSLLFRRYEEKEPRYRGGAVEEVRVWLAALADIKDHSEADAIVDFLDDCVQRCMRTPERYLDVFEEIRDANISDTARWPQETTTGGLPSPLVMTLLEQLDHRIHAVSVQEQQHSPGYESAIYSLRALFRFIKCLFVSLAALCEPRALPVLRALVDKITTGKGFNDTTGGEAIRSSRAETLHLQMLLQFRHPNSESNKIDDSAMAHDSAHVASEENFEMFLAKSISVTGLIDDPVLRAQLIEKVMVGHGGVDNDQVGEQVSNILRAVCLVSHRVMALKESHEDTERYMRSLILLIAELMAKFMVQSPLPMQRAVREYVFRENEVLKGFWNTEESSIVSEAIGHLLDSSGLNVSETPDCTLLEDITGQWASYLHSQLRNPISGALMIDSRETNPKFALALLWLRYAHPRVLCDLFDLAYSYRSQPESSANAMLLLDTTVEALGRHARITSEVANGTNTEPFFVEGELRRRLPVFLTLFSERDTYKFDSASLEELILHALQSRLPIGFDGISSDLLAERLIHTRRRHHWKQRLENASDMLDSNVFFQIYLDRDEAQNWSSTTTKIVCSAIYNGYIELNALSSWLIRLSTAPSHTMLHTAELLVPVLHAYLDCSRVSGYLSNSDKNKQGELWQAYGVHFSFLLNLASHAPPILSAKTQMMCGICIVILLDLSIAHPSSHGQKFTHLLMKHILTLPRDDISLVLLEIGKKCVSCPDRGFNEVGEGVVDHALRWTVRKLTGGREIEGNDIQFLSEITSLLAAKSTIKPHLAEPVLTAVVREHLHSEIALKLLTIMLPKADLKPLVVNRHLQILVQHPHFGKLTSSSVNRALINTLYTLFHLHPFNTCQSSHVQPLVALYRGSASVADRKLLAIFRLFENQRRTSVASLLARWNPSPEGFHSTNAFEALKDVDSLVVLRTTLHFPQWRVFENDESWDEWPEASEIYDPAFLLLLFAHVLVEDIPKTAPGWVELFRTNVVGLAFRALSAKDGTLREFAAAQIAVLWRCLEHAEMLEKPHVFHILSLLRDALHPAHGHTPERLPSYTTLLLAHALRGVFYPSNFVYPVTARFLLQRPALDIGDVPMLYGMLYSSAEDHGKKDHAWIIRMLADGMQSSLDWRVFKRRHTWDLLASVFQSEEKERALRRGVLEVLANLTCVPEAAMSLLLKSNLLTWIEMQLLTPQEDEGLAWLKILENILVVSHHEKMETSTGGQWRACLARCILLLLNACKSLRSFPIAHLITRIVLRIALLSGTLPPQMPKLLTRCVSVIKEQERNWTLLPVTSAGSMIASGPLFPAPHGAFKLHEIPQLSESASGEAQGESIEQLWRVAMLVDVDRKLAAWDELTSLLLLWRASKGEHSVVGEWARREAVKNMCIRGIEGVHKT